MGRPPDVECGSCGAVMSGYTRAELEVDGWIWHVRRGVAVFVTCDSCEEMYAERRKAKAAASDT